MILDSTPKLDGHSERATASSFNKPKHPVQTNEELALGSIVYSGESPFQSVSAVLSQESVNPAETISSSIPLVSSESDTDSLRRKHCNCTKSQCLKLYCDCFANGEFCKNCNCKDCFNNIDNEEEREKAIRICLERNPHAFK